MTFSYPRHMARLTPEMIEDTVSGMTPEKAGQYRRDCAEMRVVFSAPKCITDLFDGARPRV